MVDTYVALLKQALEQVPALTVVAVLLWVFLKSFERVIGKLTAAQDELRELYRETLSIISTNSATLTKYETTMVDINHVAAELAHVAKNMQDNCPAQRLLKEFQTPKD